MAKGRAPLAAVFRHLLRQSKLHLEVVARRTVLGRAVVAGVAGDRSLAESRGGHAVCVAARLVQTRALPSGGLIRARQIKVAGARTASARAGARGDVPIERRARRVAVAGSSGAQRQAAGHEMAGTVLREGRRVAHHGTSGINVAGGAGSRVTRAGRRSLEIVL